MRLPFPLPLTIGTDIIHCRRIFDWSIHPCPSLKVPLIKKYLHPADIKALTAKFQWWQQAHVHSEGEKRSLSRYLAGRWAAKEAAKKAWGADTVGFRDLVVEKDEEGRVRVVCFANDGMGYGGGEGGGERGDGERVTEQVGMLSISHDGEYAMATVIAAPLHEDIVADLERVKGKAKEERKARKAYWAER